MAEQTRPPVHLAHAAFRRLTYGLLCLQGCECTVTDVYVYLPPCGPPPAQVAVGDTILVSAEAHGKGALIGTLLYSAKNHPGRFRWRVAPDSVAAISRGGLLVPLRPGAGQVEASTEGVTGETPVIVLPPTTFVTATFPGTISVGDTLVIQFAARDSLGRPLTLPFGPTILLASPLLEQTRYETERVTFVARKSGVATLRWCYAYRMGTSTVQVN